MQYLELSTIVYRNAGGLCASQIRWHLSGVTKHDFPATYQHGGLMVTQTGKGRDLILPLARLRVLFRVFVVTGVT